MDQNSFVFTKDKYCLGCNKCIFVCPVHANEAFVEADNNKVFIKDGFCISCGQCLTICGHGARDYDDDFENFFNDLEKGEKISVVIAPAANFNFTNVKRLIGYLKSIGINNVFDVSFGADICTWAHAKLIEEQNIKSLIAQPCPVVVSYIEKYRPRLIEYLSPIQSPVVCTGIYAKEYMGVTDKILFLSPCIGKKRESDNKLVHDVLDYNVTMTKFIQYLKDNKVNLDKFPEENFDNMQGSIGFTFSRPGGMSENIKFNLGREDVWIKQVEGIKDIKAYLDEYIEDIDADNPLPLIVDVLNCEHGCNLGTGTPKSARRNQIDYFMNKNKANISRELADKLNGYFNGHLNIEDFKRRYYDRSFDYIKKLNVDMESAFISLGKITQQDRKVNCFSCGYGNCFDFAYDLATGHNDKSNCRHYLLNKFKKLSLYDELTGVNNRNHFNLTLDRISEHNLQFLGIIFIDINGLKEANDTYGHGYGDELIVTCAQICKKVFDDSVYRIGGDEFVILFENSHKAQFAKKVEELSALLTKEDRLIVSVGSSVCYNKDEVSQKIEEADQSMYKAKQEYYKNIGKADRRNRRF